MGPPSDAADLGRYRAMRDLERSTEPDGYLSRPVNTGRLRFVVHRHRARRLHYDLRLEIDGPSSGGAMASWAVPKGPSLDPRKRSLAIEVEDHPYYYSWFEGVIADGYGKGDVVLWDDGWWEPDPEGDDTAVDDDPVVDDDPGFASARAAGELRLVLHGSKLRGRFILVRTADEDWLLIHRRDGDAVSSWNIDDHPRSVLSGRTNDELRDGAPATWPGPSDDELRALRALPGSGEWEVDGRVVHLTNLDKVMITRGEGGPTFTKRDLVEYYARIAPWIGPYLWGRPVNLHRFPDGVHQPGFWHKAVPTHAPEWIRRWPSPFASGAERDYFVLDGAASLAWVANYGAIELHPWTSTAANADVPSYALIDIDPGPDTMWTETLVLARLFRTAIEHLGLVARPKVTGQRGIQIWMPVHDAGGFDDTRRFVEALSRAVGATVPDMVSWKWHTADRHGKARLDYTQNAVNKTLVAPFSIRPGPGAPVSVPIEWDELDDDDLRPDRWTARTVWDRLSTIGDPFRALIGVRQQLPDL